MLDWLIRNSVWITTILVSIILSTIVLRKTKKVLPPNLEELQEKLKPAENNDAGGIDDLLGGVLGGKSNTPAALPELFLNYVTLFIATALTKFINSVWFKSFIGLVLVILIGAVVYYPIAKIFDQVAYKTAALEFPQPICKRDNPKKLLLFIHGWNGDGEDTWSLFPNLVCEDARMAEFEAISINYPTYIENRHLRIAELAAWVDQNLSNRFLSDKELDIDVIAHSMGGLVAKELVVLDKLSDKESVKKLVTIGSPHNGAIAAGLLSALRIDDEFIEDMTVDSVYLKGLRVRWNKIKNRPSIHCFSSPNDRIVSVSSAFFQCDTQFTYPQWSHTEMVKPNNSLDERYLLPIGRILEN